MSWVREHCSGAPPAPVSRHLARGMLHQLSRNLRQLGRVADKGFKGGCSPYLETGKDGKQLDRIDWVESRNLGTQRLDLGGRFMAATARESVRVAGAHRRRVGPATTWTRLR